MVKTDIALVVRRYVLLVIFVQLGGCASFEPDYPASSGVPDQQSTVKRPKQEPIEPVERQEAPSANAVMMLLDQADDQYRAGHYRRSIAIAERAMRLNRYEPRVYLLLARNYFALQGYDQAESLVFQGLPLAQGSNQVESSFRALLEEIRKAAQYY